jgi:hypothetical protein
MVNVSLLNVDEVQKAENNGVNGWKGWGLKVDVRGDRPKCFRILPLSQSGSMEECKLRCGRIMTKLHEAIKKDEDMLQEASLDND